jgi:hypothetical protein
MLAETHRCRIGENSVVDPETASGRIRQLFCKNSTRSGSGSRSDSGSEIKWNDEVLTGMVYNFPSKISKK